MHAAHTCVADHGQLTWLASGADGEREELKVSGDNEPTKVHLITRREHGQMQVPRGTHTIRQVCDETFCCEVFVLVY